MPISTAQIYAGLQYTNGAKWPGPTLTFSIPNAIGSTWSPTSYPPGDESSNADYGVLSPSLRTAFVNAVAGWDRLIVLDLIQVQDTEISQGDIRVAITDTDDYTDDPSAAFAYPPPRPGAPAFAFHGDIWIDSELKDDDADFGSFLFETMLHELGHALGLKHPFEDERLPSEFDNTRFTVMSYTDFADNRLRYFELDAATGGLVGYTFLVQPTTPMIFDIVAIQGLYGASNDVQLGASTYAFDEILPYILTLVDNGGIDTFDLSRHTRSSIVNLTPGTFSSIGYLAVEDQIAVWTARYPNSSASFIANFLNRPGTYTWTDNIATSLDTVIENVLGGSGADTINGNSVGNVLSGGGGSDRIFGALGNDTIDGGSAGPAGNYLRGEEGNDSIVGGANFDDANGNMGNDTISTGDGDDFCVGGRDNDLLFGDGGADFVYGNLGDDTCNGGDGADVVRGGQGNDTLSGGAGNDFLSGDRGDDTMVGGAGADIFHSSSDAGIDRVLDFSLTEGDRVQLDPGTTFTVSQVGGDTVIQMSAGQVILVGIQMSTLPAGTIFGA